MHTDAKDFDCDDISEFNTRKIYEDELDTYNYLVEHLPDLSICNLLEKGDKDNNPLSRMVFSTYPTMMNAIDSTKQKDERRCSPAGILIW